MYVGAYIGGFGTAPGPEDGAGEAYAASVKKWYPTMAAVRTRFVYNYYTAAWALVLRARRSRTARSGRSCRRRCPARRRVRATDRRQGLVKLDSRRQAIQDQYQLQIEQGTVGTIDRRLRAERGPDVRRRVRAEQAGAGPQTSRPA